MKRSPVKCGECGAREGQSHEYGCDHERCPFCGGQLMVCHCAYTLLGLKNKQQYDAKTAHLPPEIYKNGLTEEQETKWMAILIAVGRIPFIDWPFLCAKCGCLRPALFGVPDEEWIKYIQIDKRGEVVCRPCFDRIKELIDAGSHP